jgi:hypothetical protein
LSLKSKLNFKLNKIEDDGFLKILVLAVAILPMTPVKK